MNRGNGVLAWGLGGCALGAALLATGAGRAAAPEGLRGVWTAERSNWRVEKGGTTTIVQLSLRRVGGRGHWDSSHSVPLAELDGLTSAAMDAPSADARFAWKRDAGAFAFEGRFQAGAGAGHFTFTPSAAYLADMRSRGYGDIDEEKALSLAIHDVSRAFLGELAALGYERVPMDKLMALRIHGVSLEFVAQLKALGYAGVGVDELVSLRIHGVTTDFIRRVQGRASGKAVTVDRLVSMRIHGEEPE